MLDRREAFRIINSEKFSIEYVQLDTANNTGGKKVFYPEATLHKRKSTESADLTPLLPKEGQGVVARKNPNHMDNLTINILLPGEQIRKVHVPLILKVNGIAVL